MVSQSQFSCGSNGNAEFLCCVLTHLEALVLYQIHELGEPVSMNAKAVCANICQNSRPVVSKPFSAASCT